MQPTRKSVAWWSVAIMAAGGIVTAGQAVATWEEHEWPMVVWQAEHDADLEALRTEVRVEMAGMSDDLSTTLDSITRSLNALNQRIDRSDLQSIEAELWKVDRDIEDRRAVGERVPQDVLQRRYELILERDELRSNLGLD